MPGCDSGELFSDIIWDADEPYHHATYTGVQK
jgi:hypothetical protein